MQITEQEIFTGRRAQFFIKFWVLNRKKQICTHFCFLNGSFLQKQSNKLFNLASMAYRGKQRQAGRAGDRRNFAHRPMWSARCCNRAWAAAPRPAWHRQRSADWHGHMSAGPSRESKGKDEHEVGGELKELIWLKFGHCESLHRNCI